MRCKWEGEERGEVMSVSVKTGGEDEEGRRKKWWEESEE